MAANEVTAGSLATERQIASERHLQCMRVLCISRIRTVAFRYENPVKISDVPFRSLWFKGGKSGV